MIIYRDTRNGVTGIEFCCRKMAEFILLGSVVTGPWTDHDITFSIATKDGSRGMQITNCPRCGAKIVNELDENGHYTERLK